MAQNITIMGGSYSDVPAVNLPKTGGGTATFTDVSDTTATDGFVADGEIYYKSSGDRSVGTAKYAGSATVGGAANSTAAIPYGVCDGTSTSTAYTATVDGITSLYDGVTVLLKNGVVTSAEGFTIDINGLGAKPVYNNMATGNPITPTNPTRDSTIFNINYTMLLVYSSTIVSGGGWICYRGYNSDTNTIAYAVRKNSTAMPTAIRSRYYRIFFTAADNAHWEPANTNYTNSATSVKTVNTRPINPFGAIAYTSASTNYTAGTNVAASTLWYQYTLSLGYSFNTTGEALNLTFPAPVFVKCAPQNDGSAVIDSTTPIVQALPNTADGKIYIYLGMAYNATNIELNYEHPVYEYKDGAIRLWTNTPKELPSVSSADDGKVLRVVDGAWTAASLPSANGVSF